MRRGVVLLVAAVAAIVAARPAGADEPRRIVLGRADVVRRAVIHGGEVAARLAEVARYEALAGQADAARWPRMTLDLGLGPSLQARRVPGTAVQSRQNAYGDVDLGDLTVTFGGELQLLQPLFTFGKIDLRREAAALGIDAAQGQVRIEQTAVALEAARLYEGLLLARDLVRFFEEVTHTLRRSREETEARLQVPDADLGEQDLYRLDTALALARVALGQAQAGLRQAQAGLRAYLALQPDEIVAPADEMLRPVHAAPPVAEQLVALALQRRAELQALERGAQAYERLAEAEWAGYYPDFFVLGFVSGAYTPGRDLVDTRFVVDPLMHFVPGLVVGLRWTLQGDMAGRRADEMRAEAMRLRALRRWAERGVPAQVRKAYEDVQRARGDLEAVRPALKRAKQWLVTASADYAIGMASSRDVTDAVEAYVRLRLTRADATYRLNTALAELAAVTGGLVGGNDPLYPGPADDDAQRRTP